MTGDSGNSGLDRVLVLEVTRVTEAAAIAAARLRGRGAEKAADKAAVDAMRRELARLSIRGTVVIGEGEMDEAPMLYIGEKVGSGEGPEVDIAVDPLEGTTICAKSMPNALAVLAISERGGLLHAPDMYMNKIAIGPGYAAGLVDLDAPAGDNIIALAKAKGVPVSEITACILDRPRHAELIAAVRAVGAAVQLIPDGDIAGVIWTTDPDETGIDIYLGSGGAPEGVLAAAALRCIGGQMQGRLMPANDEERARAAKMGIPDISKKFLLEDLASGDVIFSATGVTDGSLLDGVRFRGDSAEVDSVVMRSKTGTVRRIKSTCRSRLIDATVVLEPAACFIDNDRLNARRPAKGADVDERDAGGYSVTYGREEIQAPVYFIAFLAAVLLAAGLVWGSTVALALGVGAAGVAYYNFPLIERRPIVGANQYGIFMQGLGLIRWTRHRSHRPRRDRRARQHHSRAADRA